MKSSFVYSILLVLVVFCLACKKDRTCTCGTGVNAISYSIEGTRKQAKDSCNAAEKIYRTSCQLK